MFETWRAQNNAPPYDVNREALRQALQAEEARVRQELRTRHRMLGIGSVVGIGMAIFAGSWIAISISNRWPAIYAIASGVSFGLFVLGVGALWVRSEPRVELERNFANTLQEEVRRNLALVDYQLSVTKRWIFSMLGTVFIVGGTMLFSWTINSSQDIPTSPFRSWWKVLLIVFFVWVSYKARDEMRKAKPKLELRQRRLRELLATLEARE